MVLSVAVFANDAEAAGLVWRAVSKVGSLISDLGDVGASGCSNGEVLKYQTSNSTWICGTDATGSGIASINGDTTAAQTIVGVTGNTTASTTSGATTVNLGTDVVMTGGSAQTITKGLTINSGTLGGDLNANQFTINGYDVETITTTNTLGTDNEVVLLNPSTTAFTVTLPDATGNTGKHYRFNYIATTGTVVTIDGEASDTINGKTSIIMKYPHTSMDMYSDGTNWYASYDDQIFPRENYIVMTDEFVGGAGTITTATEGELGWISVGTGTESGVKIDGVTDHPGIKVIATQPTSPAAGDDHTIFLGAAATTNVFVATDPFDLTFIVRPGSAAGAITTVTYHIGANLNTASGSTITAENAMFLFDTSGGQTGADTTHWVCRTRSSGGTDQTTATAVTVTANTWYNLRVLKDSGTIRFLIDDVNVCNHSTQIPSGALNPFLEIETVTTGAIRSIDIDYFRGSFITSSR